jgi:transposase
MARKRTQKQVEELSQEAAAMHTAGLEPALIAEELDVSLPYAYNLLARAGVAIQTQRGAASKLNKQQIDDIVTRYQNGERIVTLLGEYGLSYTSFYTLLRNQGLDYPTWKGEQNDTSRVRLQVAVSLYTDGAPIKVIIAQTGVHQPMLHQELYRLGIPLRRQSRIPRTIREQFQIPDAVDPIP